MCRGHRWKSGWRSKKTPLCWWHLGDLGENIVLWTGPQSPEKWLALEEKPLFWTQLAVIEKIIDWGAIPPQAKKWIFIEGKPLFWRHLSDVSDVLDPTVDRVIVPIEQGAPLYLSKKNVYIYWKNGGLKPPFFKVFYIYF